MSDFIFLGSKVTADGDCSLEIKRHLLLGRKVMTNLDSILKSRDITLSIKIRLVKAMVLPVVMYGCKSKVTQSYLTLCDPMDCSLPGSSVHRIFQARVLEWVAISFSRRSSWPRDRTQVSCIVGRRSTVWVTREGYGCESWTIKKAEHRRKELMLFNCGVGEDSWESLGLWGDPTRPS